MLPSLINNLPDRICLITAVLALLMLPVQAQEKEQLDPLYLPWGKQQGTPESRIEWYFNHRAHLMINGSTWVIWNKGLEERLWSFADEVDAKVVTRHTKAMKAKGPAWPSASPADQALQVLLKQQPDRIQSMLQSARQHQITLMSYYFISMDEDLERAHPEWVCKDPRGKAIPYKPNKNYEASWLDITGPYREVILARLIEQADRGIKGFMFDEIHMPFEGAWGTSTQKAWEKLGKRTPKRIDLDDENYRDYVKFMYDRVWATFAYWRQEVQKKYPDVVFTVSVTALPKLLSDRMPSSVGRQVDGFKNEFNLTLRAHRFDYKNEKTLLESIQVPDDVRLGFSWALLRDASMNLPPRLWAPVGTFKASGQLSVWAVMLYGNIANLGTMGTQLQDKKRFDAEKVKYYREAIEAGTQVGQWYEGRALGGVGVYFSERLRDRYQGDKEKAYDKAIRPALAWYWAGTRQHIPMRIVLDWQLAELDPKRTPFLLVPVKEDLDEEASKQLTRYMKAGGGIGYFHYGDDFQIKDGESQPKALHEMRRILEAALEVYTHHWMVIGNTAASKTNLQGGHVVVHPRKNGNWVLSVIRLDAVVSHKNKLSHEKISTNLKGTLTVRRPGYVIESLKALSKDMRKPVIVGVHDEEANTWNYEIDYESQHGMAVFEIEWKKE